MFVIIFAFWGMKAEELYNATLPLSLQNMWHNTAYFGISSFILCSSFKNISHSEFSNEDGLLVQMCYQQSHNAEKLEAWTWCINDTLSFLPPCPPLHPQKRDILLRRHQEGWFLSRPATEVIACITESQKDLGWKGLLMMSV